jgi:hypothetical protein
MLFSMDSSEMGKKRWEGTTSKQRREYARKLSIARLNKLTAEERSEIARVAVKARWEKWRAEHPEGSPKVKTQARANGRPLTQKQKPVPTQTGKSAAI